jgi:hypothetical protein
VFLNLCAGLARIGVPYRVNDFRHIRRHPEELACIVGKPYVLHAYEWNNPIMFGAAVYSHPDDDPTLLDRFDIRRVLVPGEWMRNMCLPYWGNRVVSWPVGIDTQTWSDTNTHRKSIDLLIYDKIRWERDKYVPDLLDPIRGICRERGLSFREMRYGSYREQDFHSALAQSKAMIFICEHETQGIAYLQALSRNIPTLAWNRGGFWQDPSYYPRVAFAPVSSVPYWDRRCGATFKSSDDFGAALTEFWAGVKDNAYHPRSYVLENLTLELCARHYASLAAAASRELVPQ